ncbi:MAG: SAM-dependent DNA methyltransferase, partial [Rhodobacteraceae bacterium]|nr:SAM-dependent DNA methyltransferase [Paracoccaceae bacterium]
ALTAALKQARIEIAAPVKKAILDALSERDEAAHICTDKNGRPDPDLRDRELVPLTMDWRDYMEREVLPFVPDAVLSD